MASDEDFIVHFELDVRDARGSADQLTTALARLNKEIDSPELQRAEKNLAKFAGSQGEASKAAEKHNQSLSTTRYALYDVSQTLAIAGAAMIALGVATVGTAISFERDFANVVRTSGVAGEGISKLRDDFLELAQTIPLSFAELTKIGTLGGQLGVPAKDLANFTRVVAEFSATTDLSVDAAATAFGRLNSLLPSVQGNYNALGSSILKVGVNSVATEGQIVKTATNISAMGTQAGLTASEVVGLAGAFASIGVQPELARGTITRTFSLIGKAVAEGGDKLDNFAKLAGVSSSELANAYGTDKFGPIFLKFIEGIRGVSEEGGNASIALNNLGITSVRDVPALLNLANAADSAGRAGKLLAQTTNDANSGFQEQTALGEQYGIIAGTVAAKLTVLNNNFQVFLATLGGSSTGPLAYVIESFTRLLKIATDLAANPVGQWFAVAAIAAATLGGALLLIVAGAARGYAGILGLQQALVGMNVQLVAGQVGFQGFIAQLLTMGTAGTVAGRGLQVASIAAKGLGIALVGVGIAAAGLAVTKGIGDISYALEDKAKDFDSALGRVRDSAAETTKFFAGDTFKDTINRAMSPFSNSTLIRDLVAVDEGLAQITKSGGASDAAREIQELSAAFIKAGGTQEGFNSVYVDTIAALKEAGYQVEYTRTGVLNLIAPTATATKGLGEFATAEEEATARAESLADQLGISSEELKSFQSGIASGSGAFVNFGDLIQRVQDKTRGFAEQTSKETYGSIDSWQEFYDGSSVNIYDFMALLDEQIANQSTWADDLKVLSARGATGFVSEIAKMGPESAPLAAAAVNLTVDELNKLESQARLAAFLGSEAFAEGFTDNIPSLQDAYAKGGLEAVQALIEAQTSASPQAVAAVVSQFNLDASKQPIQFQSALNSAGAVRDMDNIIRYLSGRSVTIQTNATNPNIGFGLGNGHATGGYIRGPGNATSDSIPARLSNGEYVIKASSVRQYGTGLFDQLNRGVKKFASGGPVGHYAGGGPVSGGSGGVQMVSLDARSSALLERVADRPVVISGTAVAGAANASNLNSGNRGAN